MAQRRRSGRQSVCHIPKPALISGPAFRGFRDSRSTAVRKREMENSRHKQHIGFEARAIPSSRMTSRAVSLRPARDVNHPFVQCTCSRPRLGCQIGRVILTPKC